jgi:hypothetical protein
MAIRKVKINGEEHELQTTIANVDGLNDILDTTARLDLEDNENIEDANGGASANAVLHTPQTLTEAQKTQARANIGAVGADDIGGFASKSYLVEVFGELKTAIAESNIDAAVAILDKVILDLSALS